MTRTLQQLCSLPVDVQIVGPLIKFDRRGEAYTEEFVQSRPDPIDTKAAGAQLAYYHEISPGALSALGQALYLEAFQTKPRQPFVRVFPTGVSEPRYLSFAAPRPAYLETVEKNINVLSALAVTASELKRLGAWQAGLVLASAVHENSPLLDVSCLRDMAFHQVDYYDIDVVFWLWTEDPSLKQRLRETCVAGGWQFAEEIRG